MQLSKRFSSVRCVLATSEGIPKNRKKIFFENRERHHVVSVRLRIGCNSHDRFDITASRGHDPQYQARVGKVVSIRHLPNNDGCKSCRRLRSKIVEEVIVCRGKSGRCSSKLVARSPDKDNESGD